MSSRANGKSGIMGCHCESRAGHITPKQSGRKMNGVKRTGFGWHRLGSPLKDSVVYVDQLEGVYQSQDSSAAQR